MKKITVRQAVRQAVWIAVMACIVLLVQAAPGWCQAMPWEGPLQQIITSITGPVARAIGIVSIFIFGAAMALSEGGGLRVVMGIVLGLSIMFAAASWGLTFFGFAGGA
jgi:type IV secretion system protein VirB2